jgi:ribosomal-protein-alanine N-acetyltransferase
MVAVLIRSCTIKRSRAGMQSCALAHLHAGRRILKMWKLPSLETHNLNLRRLTQADAADVFAIFSDPEVGKYDATRVHRSMDDTRRLIDSLSSANADEESFAWGIESKAASTIIGVCQIALSTNAQSVARIAFILGRKYRRAGYMTEALAAVFDYVFDAADLSVIEADVDLQNADSCRLLAKLGFREDSSRRENLIWKNEKRCVGTFVLDKQSTLPRSLLVRSGTR